MVKIGDIKTRSTDNETELIILYSVSIGVWIIMIWMLDLLRNTYWVSKLILILPVILFVLNFVVDFSEDAILDTKSKQGNVLTFFFIVSGIIVSWRNMEKKGNRTKLHRRIIKTVILTFFLLTFLHVEIAYLKNNPVIDAHFDLILIAYVLTLLGYSITEFFSVEYL